MSDPKPPLTTTTSIKPAASVLVIAVVLLAFFLVVNIVTSPRTASTTTIPIIVGGLDVDSASQLPNSCELPGNPPSDIRSSLLVPTNTTQTQPAKWKGQGPGGFDCTLNLSNPASDSELLGFYKSQLEARGWKLFSQNSAVGTGMPQFLFQKAGSDTFYWILGITIVDHSEGRTTYSERLYQGASLI